MINKQALEKALEAVAAINAANDLEDKQCERARLDRIARGISYSGETLKQWLARRLDRNLPIDEWQRTQLIALRNSL